MRRRAGRAEAAARGMVAVAMRRPRTMKTEGMTARLRAGQCAVGVGVAIAARPGRVVRGIEEEGRREPEGGRECVTAETGHVQPSTKQERGRLQPRGMGAAVGTAGDTRGLVGPAEVAAPCG